MLLYVKNIYKNKTAFFIFLTFFAFLHPGPWDPRMFWDFDFTVYVRVFCRIWHIFCNFPSFSSKVSLCTWNRLAGGKNNSRKLL